MTGEFQIPDSLDSAQRALVLDMDSLIGDLDPRVDTRQGLMREHLTAARSYLVGSMPGEYKSTLQLAKALLPEIEPPELRTRVDELLQHT
jgi:hypothetical protein